jgi:hypothetical protein
VAQWLLKIKIPETGVWNCGSMVEHLSSTFEALDLSLALGKQNKQKKRRGDKNE